MPVNFIATEALRLNEANFMYTSLAMTYRGYKRPHVALPFPLSNSSFPMGSIHF